MRFTYPILQVLALCQYASASPCKPSTTTAPLDATTSATESSVITATTSSAEPSTTTSSGPQQPTNLLRNPGFEEDTIAPWVRPRSDGTISISTSDSHGGSQSGYMTGAPGGPAAMGFKQSIDSSLIEADTNYQFSAWVKTTLRGGCFNQQLQCGTGNAIFGQSNFGGALDTWVLATGTCSWTQAALDAGPSVLITGTCERLNFYVDDAVLVKGT